VIVYLFETLSIESNAITDVVADGQIKNGHTAVEYNDSIKLVPISTFMRLRCVFLFLLLLLLPPLDDKNNNKATTRFA
jgi:hypothetical protein